jgi:Inner membrane component of T3SS, cytoplasmic domain
MARLTITTGGQAGAEFQLKPGINRIGRSPENDFHVCDASVSAHHCEVTRSELTVWVRDLKSTNGTYADGKAVTSDAPERFEQVLQIGSTVLQLQIDRNGADAPIVRVPELPVEQPIRSGELPDGSPACANHPTGPATYRCGKCEQTLCDACVRVVHRQGGLTLVFCSLCSGACEPLPPAHSARRPWSFLGWLKGSLVFALTILVADGWT